MEMMPHRYDVPSVTVATAAPGLFGSLSLPNFETTHEADWREGLPALVTPLCTLRELELSDAPSLLAHLTTEQVARFISPPPDTVEGFEDFIRWARLRRSQGRYACFGIVPLGATHAVGMFQVRLSGYGEGTAEWGFVLGSAFWGTGIFVEGAAEVLTFLFEELGLERVEARAVLQNGRANGALRKVGAVRETVLAGTFERNGQVMDQGLWVVTRDAWLRGHPDAALSDERCAVWLWS